MEGVLVSVGGRAIVAVNNYADHPGTVRSGKRMYIGTVNFLECEWNRPYENFRSNI